MKLNRRILSLVLVLCILLTLVPIQAMAVPITGTVGPGGAPWRLYDDGTLIVEPGHIDWDHTESPWHVHSDDISTIEFTGPIAAGPHLQNLFNGLSNVHTITGLEHFDTSGVTTMANMFRDAIRLTSLNLSGWDTSNVTNMSLMFSGTALRQLTLGEEFAFIDGTAAALPAVPNSDGYTGRWQNIGNGTIYAPAGSYELTSAELMDEFDGPDMADTWIWQWSHGLASLEDHVFPSAILGYDPQMPHTVIVTSTGAQPTGNLTITVTTVAGNNNAFTFSMNLLASILSPGGTASFTVTPNPGLPVGTHTVEVTVHNANGISEVFTVSFTVNPLSPHTVTFALNGGTYNGNQALLVQTVPHGQNATALSGNPSRPGF
ncbi:MAG: BspA family leucine-rich repeat surface protein, partial [Oscillospiraceae bacterium]|nr:BspA family leucine-rich repeat surface protein [Oscillospiraceae bacterium]